MKIYDYEYVGEWIPGPLSQGKGRGMGPALASHGVISIFRQSITLWYAGNSEWWKYFVKLKWVLDRTKRRAFAVLSSSDSHSLCRFSKAGNTEYSARSLWPCERLTNSRLLKSWGGGTEVISFNYSVFVLNLTNVYGVGDWSDQIKKFQITLTRRSPVGWGLGRPHDLNMESIHRGHGNIRDGAAIVKIRHRRVKTSQGRLWLNNVRCGCDASHSFNAVNSHNIEPTQRIQECL